MIGKGLTSFLFAVSFQFFNRCNRLLFLLQMCCMPRMRRKKNQTNLTNTWKSYRCETRHPPCCYTPRIYFPVQIYDRADICKYWDWFNLLKMGVDSFVMYVFVFVCVLCANLCYTRAWTHIIGLSFLCTCTAYRRLYTHKDWDLVSRALVFVCRI